MRSFTIEGIYNSGKKVKYDGGRFMSETPSRAAAKAFNKACKFANKKGRAVMIVKLRETTQGSPKKTFNYKVARIKEPREIVRDGRTIVYMYTTKVRSI